MVRGATGIEIGGPSPIFARAGLLPLYPHATRIDNCTFARSTIWEGTINPGPSVGALWGKVAGRQFICEGTALDMIPHGHYGFILSSHMLEHAANPLRALAEWRRVLQLGGGLVLVVPHRDGTFDHRRPVTTLQHLVEDFEREVGEDDVTHVAEILELHDGSRDPGMHQITFRDRAERNAELRSLHHHVFDTRLAVAAVETAGFEVFAVEPLPPHHIVVLARKPHEGVAVRRLAGDVLRVVLRRSPFPTDHHGL